ncbi:hypothetical protein AHAS_Ahas15G0172000 [Arachis hypogaea]
MEDINSFQPCKIIVIKICGEISVISTFVDKHNIYSGSDSPSIEILGDDNTNAFSTPKRKLILLDSPRSWLIFILILLLLRPLSVDKSSGAKLCIK